MGHTHKCGQLCVVGFGLALGITNGLYLLILGLVAWLSHFGTKVVVAIGGFYAGYAPTLLGSFYGALWGFVDLFIAGIIIAWIYNFIYRCCGKSECRGGVCKPDEVAK